MFADVDGELLGSAPSLDVWNMTGIRRGQADPGVSELATSSSSGLGAAPCACPLLCAVPFVPFALLPLCPLLSPHCAPCSVPFVAFALPPVCALRSALFAPFALSPCVLLLCPLCVFCSVFLNYAPLCCYMQ